MNSMFLHVISWRVSTWQQNIKEGGVGVKSFLRACAYLVGVYNIALHTNTREGAKQGEEKLQMKVLYSVRWWDYFHTGQTIN